VTSLRTPTTTRGRLSAARNRSVGDAAIYVCQACGTVPIPPYSAKSALGTRHRREVATSKRSADPGTRQARKWQVSAG
jgi:hypothetical protein